MEGDKVLVELAAGAQSPYDLRPVQHDTLFSCFSVTKGVAAAAVHYLVDQGLVDLHEPVCTYWPAFAAKGKRDITVAHVLMHQAGLSNACLDDLTDDPFLASDRYVRGYTKKTRCVRNQRCVCARTHAGLRRAPTSLSNTHTPRPDGPYLTARRCWRCWPTPSPTRRRGRRPSTTTSPSAGCATASCVGQRR